jgi:hypothetical protein
MMSFCFLKWGVVKYPSKQSDSFERLYRKQSKTLFESLETESCFFRSRRAPPLLTLLLRGWRRRATTRDMVSINRSIKNHLLLGDDEKDALNNLYAALTKLNLLLQDKRGAERRRCTDVECNICQEFSVRCFAPCAAASDPLEFALRWLR